MALSDLNDPKAVLSAVQECDSLGRIEFLKKYGFGKAREYFLKIGERRYDSKAIAGVAHGYQFPDKGQLDSKDFAGGETTVAKKLASIGFTVEFEKREEWEAPIGPTSWVEITNPIHGGPGWSFGSCLWSPVRNKGGANAWELMQHVKPGDKVYHFLKLKEGSQKEYNFVGRSLVQGAAQTIEIEPPEADRWAGMAPYFRIPLTDYVPNIYSAPAGKLFELYEKELRLAIQQELYGQFFDEYGASKELRIAQAYIRHLPDSLVALFDQIAGSEFPSIHRSEEITANEPSYADSSPPGSITTLVTRKIRDTKLTRELKIRFNWNCAICGKRITLPNGAFYAEAHHVRPLGAGHNGLDKADNILILCPYHHAEFDYGSIGIHPVSRVIVYTARDNEYDNKRPAYSIDHVHEANLRYHWDLNHFQIKDL